MLYLHGIGHYHPDNVIDNQFLEDLNIETNNDWIIDRVGIRERRTILDLNYIKDTYNKDPNQAKQFMQLTSTQTGAKAATMALERAKLLPAQIGMVIAGGCAPAYSLPANACVIADELGIQATALDINSACSTFIAHTHLIKQMQTESLPDYILMIIPENWSTTVDFSDRKTAVLVGDCSVAAIVSKKHKSNIVINHTSLASDVSGWRKVMTPTREHFYQDGPAVQRFAIKKTIETIKHMQHLAGLEPNQYTFIGHQANLTMLKSVCRKAGIAEDNHLYNVDQFGNCGAAGTPSVLSQYYEKLESGDKLLLIAVGSGLTWGGMDIKVE